MELNAKRLCRLTLIPQAQGCAVEGGGSGVCGWVINVNLCGEKFCRVSEESNSFIRGRTRGISLLFVNLIYCRGNCKLKEHDDDDDDAGAASDDDEVMNC